MQKLFENWRKYLNEGGALGHYDTDVDGDQDTDVQDVLKVAQIAAGSDDPSKVLTMLKQQFQVDHLDPEELNNMASMVANKYPQIVSGGYINEEDLQELGFDIKVRPPEDLEKHIQQDKPEHYDPEVRTKASELAAQSDNQSPYEWSPDY